jgi:hypothetical protein
MRISSLSGGVIVAEVEAHYFILLSTLRLQDFVFPLREKFITPP